MLHGRNAGTYILEGTADRCILEGMAGRYRYILEGTAGGTYEKERLGMEHIRRNGG